MYLAVAFSLVSLLQLGVVADESPYYSDAKYNDGSRGKYVTQSFKSNPQVTAVPQVNFMKPFTNCDDGSYLFMAPRGNSVDPTPMLLDATGALIWASEKKYGEVYNVKMQKYKDEMFLTFWAGNDAVGGHGIGSYYMLDQNYNERYHIKAANGLGGDLHEFTITPNNTALITIYQSIAIDITATGNRRGRGWIWDSMFQELDLETGEAIFEWRASTHIPITNSYNSVNSASHGDPWDVYHINSVEKDELGNFLISVRFLRAMLYIDGKTGEVLWQLGGKENSFTDLSKGKATSFMGQHDAHWLDGHKYITFFDNRADWVNKMDSQSRGTKIEVDLEQMTARLAQTFVDPFNKILSTSQGSYQTLPNGNVLLGYGYNGVVAEFSPEGELLCDAYIQPSSSFNSGDVQSYRNYKFNWTAFPDTKPNLVLDAKVLYMSWNGATEVTTYLLLDSDSYDEEYEKAADHRLSRKSIEDAIIIDRLGFETTLGVMEYGLRRFIRIVALDKNGRSLGTSSVVDIGDLATYVNGSTYEADYTYTEDDINEDIRLLIIFGCCALLSGGLIAALVLGRKKIAESVSKFAESVSRFAESIPKFSYTRAGNTEDDGEMDGDTELEDDADMVEDVETSRVGSLMQRILRFRRKDSFTDAFAREGFLDAEAGAGRRISLPEMRFSPGGSEG